jgi:hypothetical protein
MIRQVAFLVVLLCGCVGPRHSSESAFAEALVQPDRLIVTFPAIPPGTTNWPAPSTGSPGFYDWRFGVSGPSGFTGSAGILTGDATASEAHGSMVAVARRLSLRRCESGGHILTCAWAIPGNVEAIDDRLVVTLRDSSILARLNAHRPAFLWRSIFLVDRIMGVDSVPLVYRP